MTDLFEGTGHGPDATTPVKRLWWPEYYVDECMPEGTEHPDGWIRGVELGTDWLIGPEDEEAGTPFTACAGEIVTFCWYEPRGRCEITVRPDGSFDLHGAEPGDWTCVWHEDEAEMTGDTLAEYAGYFAEMELHEDRHAVRFGKWDEARFRLVVEAGNARFEPAVEAAPSPPRGEGWGEGEPQTGETSDAQPV